MHRMVGFGDGRMGGLWMIRIRAAHDRLHQAGDLAAAYAAFEGMLAARSNLIIILFSITLNGCIIRRRSIPG